MYLILLNILHISIFETRIETGKLPNPIKLPLLRYIAFKCKDSSRLGSQQN